MRVVFKNDARTVQYFFLQPGSQAPNKHETLTRCWINGWPGSQVSSYTVTRTNAVPRFSGISVHFSLFPLGSSEEKTFVFRSYVSRKYLEMSKNSSKVQRKPFVVGLTYDRLSNTIRTT